MEPYIITPWDTREGNVETPADWDMHVPPEVDELAEQVMREYDMKVSNRTLITSKPDKGGAIWRIETDKGPRSLKVLHRMPERSLYSIGLQEYVVKQGARVPALIPARDGNLFVEKGGKLWIVTDWIDLTPATKVDLVGAQELCYGLGEFHGHTKGYVPPVGAKNASRLFRWHNHYQKIAKKIGWMREVAKAYNELPASKAILAVVDHYERQAWDAVEKLKASAYPKMVKMGEPHWGLVHQDYGWSNGQNGPGGLWVIDLDGVSYDLPFRDLRKLITSTMDDMGVWDVSWMRGMIEAYHQANPLDRESFEVLLIDMALPNEFYKHLKEMFYDPTTFLATEAEAILARVVSSDQTKAAALAELAKDISKYEPGNYENIPEPVQPQRIASELKLRTPVEVMHPRSEAEVEIPVAEVEPIAQTEVWAPEEVMLPVSETKLEKPVAEVQPLSETEVEEPIAEVHPSEAEVEDTATEVPPGDETDTEDSVVKLYPRTRMRNKRALPLLTESARENQQDESLQASTNDDSLRVPLSFSVNDPGQRIVQNQMQVLKRSTTRVTTDKKGRTKQKSVKSVVTTKSTKTTKSMKTTKTKTTKTKTTKTKTTKTKTTKTKTTKGWVSQKEKYKTELIKSSKQELKNKKRKALESKQRSHPASPSKTKQVAKAANPSRKLNNKPVKNKSLKQKKTRGN